MVVQVMKIWIIRDYNVDISSYSDDGSGNEDTSRYLRYEYIEDAISNYNEAVGREVFTWIEEGDHYHITCVIASNYYYLDY